MNGTEQKEGFWTADRRRIAMMLAGPVVPPLMLLGLPLLLNEAGIPVPGLLFLVVAITGPVVGLVVAVRLMVSWCVSIGTKGLAFSCAIVNGGILCLMASFLG